MRALALALSVRSMSPVFVTRRGAFRLSDLNPAEVRRLHALGKISGEEVRLWNRARRTW